MQLRVFVLCLGAVLFLVGCGDDKPRTVVDSSDLEGIREYQAIQDANEAKMAAELAAEEGGG
ncbi:hypothetical protein Q31b_17310 [Novipirellula aureliae]|uniref:Uncharacterized protein n=1 Tax=Novipirellula aureliae TaxID=2527966 RepID=A0A5C6E6F4_9BACT|nr:hypothetical protein [Novipirellula aureliae]TWU44195.1 hypothetical protein Q31b_17310 [Novipirellula aureliae]